MCRTLIENRTLNIQSVIESTEPAQVTVSRSDESSIITFYNLFMDGYELIYLAYDFQFKYTEMNGKRKNINGV